MDGLKEDEDGWHVEMARYCERCVLERHGRYVEDRTT
jgi:hypothetical protein